MTKILLVEDDVSIHKIIRYELENKGYHVDSLYDGKNTVKQMMDNEYSLVLIDWMLPYKSGVSIISEVRSLGYSKPIILLTARSQQEDIIQGLESGADDYLLKPFQSKILIARIEAHLRRYHNHFLETLKFLDITMDLGKHEVFLNEEHIQLTKVEYDLLRMFLENKEKVLSREDLLLKIWNFSYDGDTRLVDIHVFKLKGKLKDSQACFKSVRGVGYKLVKNDE
ncbi:MAG: response regulator transcription factor [Coprobacillaceae bacterium]